MRNNYLLDADETILDFLRSSRESFAQAMAWAGMPRLASDYEKFRAVNDALWKAYERGEVTKFRLVVERFARFFAAEGVAPGFAASEAAWKRFWDSVHDFALPDPEMLRMVHVALYHLRCNATRWSQPVGIHNDLWSGKFFAFDEFFCHMGLLTSGCTELARRIPEFRRATLTVAQKRCNPFHSKEPVFGGLYPWETLEDGSNCTFPGHWEDHIFQNANSAAGAWAQFLTMRDRDFLEQTAWPILRDMARYYVSHHVYREADGGVFIGKVTDLEKLGSAHERAYLTTCGVIYTLRCAARAAGALGCTDAETRNWAELADALPASLPEKDGHYLPFPVYQPVLLLFRLPRPLPALPQLRPHLQANHPSHLPEH